MKKISKNSLRYFYFKLIRQQGPPDAIARGVAIGFFIGFLVPIGLQMVLALALAYLFRAKKIPAMACTWVTNYFTAPFIYPVQCYLGALIINSNLSFQHIKEIFSKLSVKGLLNLGAEIMVPFLVGGAILGIITAFIGYFASYGMIIQHRQRVDQRLRRKLSLSTNKQQATE